MEDKTKKETKDCQTCQHFYECDNTGHYEECLDDGQSDYEESER